MKHKNGKKRKKRWPDRIKGFVLAAAFFCFAAAGNFPAAAGQIRDIRVRIAVESFDTEGNPELEVYTGSDAYTAVGIERIFTGEEEDDTDATGPAAEIRRYSEEAEDETASGEKTASGEENTTDEQSLPQYEIELVSEAEDGFGILEEQDIHFSGAEAICHKAVRRDSGQTLLLTITLEEPGELIGTIPAVHFTQGTVSWEPAPNAAAYYAVLYCNGKRLRDGHRTEGLSFDFSALITKPGHYSCKVYPFTEKGKKGEEAETSRIMITEEETARIQTHWQAVLDDRLKSAAQGGVQGVGWIETEDGWYYLQKDGTLPARNRMEIDGSWYYFDETGRWLED